MICDAFVEIFLKDPTKVNYSVKDIFSTPRLGPTEVIKLYFHIFFQVLQSFFRGMMIRIKRH